MTVNSVDASKGQYEASSRNCHKSGGFAKIGRGGGNISNTRKSVSSDIQTLRGGLKKQGSAEFFFNQL